jgi:DNA-binding NtrC family response regulator
LHVRNLTVTTVFSGQAALSLFDGTEMDVVILDVCMPGVSGVEVLRHIKVRSPGTEVILLSGGKSIKDALQGMRLGAFDYLPEPLPVDDLDQRIHAAALEPFKRGRSEVGAVQRP